MEEFEKEPGFDKDFRREDFNRKRRNVGRKEQHVLGPFKKRPLVVVDDKNWTEGWEDDLLSEELEVPNIWDE